MRLKSRLMVSFAALVLVAGACGGDDDDSASAPTDAPDTTAAATDDTNAGAADDFKLDEPVKFVLLAETKGESSAAIPNFADGVELAIEEINAAGGIGGHPIEYERIATDPVDVAKAKTSLRQGLDADPTILFGLPSANISRGLAPDLAAAGIPTFILFSDAQLYLGAPDSVGAENIFMFRPNNATVGEDIAKYAMEDKGYKRIALLCVDGPTGQVGCDSATAVVEAAGGEIVARERHGPTDTDTTAQVQAIGAAKPDAVLTFPFPNVLGVFANQMYESGFKIPIIGGVAQGMMVDAGVVKGEAATLLTGFDDCTPAADDRPAVKEFVQKYRDKYGYRPNWASAESYDAVYIAKMAIEAAKSAEPTAIIDAMKTIEYEGMCDPNWRVDAGNGVNHNQDVVRWDAEGNPTLIKRNTIPDSGN